MKSQLEGNSLSGMLLSSFRPYSVFSCTTTFSMVISFWSPVSFSPLSARRSACTHSRNSE